MKPSLRSAGAFLLSAFLLALSTGVSPALAASAPQDLTQSLDRYLARIYPAAEPGAAVLVAKDGKVLLRDGYGMANLEHGVPITPDTVFEVGSVTKQFTAAAILMLQERGKLAVQDDITQYLTDFPTQEKKVTIHHLLTHTSGIPSYTGMKEWIPRMREDLPVGELIGFFKGKPFDFDPGTKWAYDNSGYVLLGAIIEKVSGKSYERFIEDEIFQPLGMTHSYYGSWSDVIPNRAAGYDKENDHFVNTPYLSMTQPYAAGSLMSTVGDLALWDRALSGGTLLKKESLDRMFTSGALTSGQLTRYGYGWTFHDLAGKKVIEHGGDINGFSCDVLRIPEEKILVVVLTNNTETALRPDAVTNRIAAYLLGQPLAEGSRTRLDPKALDEYTGVYRTGDVTRYILRDGDKLFGQRQGGTRRELWTMDRDTFLYAMANTSVRFTRDAQGKITGAVFDENHGPLEPEVARTNDPLPGDKKTAHVDPAVLAAYTGTYELMPGFTMIVTVEDGRLFTQPTGQSKLELFAESDTKFFLKEVDAQVEFQKGADGAVNGLVLHQGGRDLPGKKK
jgi:CubicO group peptidase (beta-lactamase class C family)